MAGAPPSGENGFDEMPELERSDTTLTDILDPSEFRELQNALAGYVARSISSLNGMLMTPHNNGEEVASSGSNVLSPLVTPTTSVIHQHHPYVDVHDTRPAVLRGDTLDRHPVFVDPVALQPLPTIPDPSVSQNGRGAPLEADDSEEGGETASPSLTSPTTPTYPQDSKPSHFGTSTRTELDQNWNDLLLNASSSAFVTEGGGVPSFNSPCPTSFNPALTDWPGEYGFKVSFHRLSEISKNKSWDFSEPLNKLFIDMNKHAWVSFEVGHHPPEGLYVRALPVYAVAGFVTEPVKRCPNHASLSDASNQNFPQEFRHHLIRVNHEGAVYQEDPSSKRLSVSVPVERPQNGTTRFHFSLKFMCLGSDVGGINRKPLKVIFTLEYEDDVTRAPVVVGRAGVDVRICSCPKRDKQQEEKRRRLDEKEARRIGDALARTHSSHPPLSSASVSSKKRKIDKELIEDMVMVPVAKADYEKLNEFAEAAMIARNLTKVYEIKTIRRRLMDKYNPNLLTKVKKEEK